MGWMYDVRFSHQGSTVKNLSRPRIAAFICFSVYLMSLLKDSTQMPRGYMWPLHHVEHAVSQPSLAGIFEYRQIYRIRKKGN